MKNNKKQLKITKIFGKSVAKLPDDCVELNEEVQLLEQKLRDKQNELFQFQRHSYRNKVSKPNPKKDELLIRPQKIVLGNIVTSLEQNVKLLAMLTGVEVQSYIANGHCCVVYHMQHKSENLIKHGLRIDMESGGNVISKSSLPIGFNVKAIMEDFDNIMMPECLIAIRKGLVAYYNRIEQFKNLTKLVNIEAETFKCLDGSHIEVSFFAQDTTEEEDDPFEVTLFMDYRIYDIRPKTYYFRGIDLPEGAPEVLKEQCSVFKRKPLHKAFKEAFFNGVGTYKLVRKLDPCRPENETRKPKKFKPNKQNYNNDDTFHPEDCSDQGEDDVIET